MTSPPMLVVVILAVGLGAVASILMTVAVAATNWEHTMYDINCLRDHTDFDPDLSYMDESQGFYNFVSKNNGSNHYLLDTYGGIWKICATATGTAIRRSVSHYIHWNFSKYFLRI